MPELRPGLPVEVRGLVLSTVRLAALTVLTGTVRLMGRVPGVRFPGVRFPGVRFPGVRVAGAVDAVAVRALRVLLAGQGALLCLLGLAGVLLGLVFGVSGGQLAALLVPFVVGLWLLALVRSPRDRPVWCGAGLVAAAQVGLWSGAWMLAVSALVSLLVLAVATLVGSVGEQVTGRGAADTAAVSSPGEGR
jgi:hypothetical protein